MLYHHTLRALPGTRLFDDWDEARLLWDTLNGLAPGPTALVLMSNHVHGAWNRDRTAELIHVMRSYSRRRNARRAASGRVWRPITPPRVFTDRTKKWRQEKYIHLNPWVIVRDPLAWPFSTHLDAVGLAIHPVRRQAYDPVRYHQRISSDDRARPGGTELPWVTLGNRVPSVQDVAAAVSHLSRTPLPRLRERNPARTLLVQCARALTDASVGDIGDHCRLTRRAIHYTEPAPPADLRRIERVLWDPRFGGLNPKDPALRWRPTEKMPA